MEVQTTTLLSQEEKIILAAVDMAMEDMERLSMITKLCHISSGNYSIPGCNSALNRLESSLEKEVVQAFQELYVFQKEYNRSKDEFAGGDGNVVTAASIPLHNPESDEKIQNEMRKQKFLEEIMERTELLKDELRRGEGILEEDSTWQLPVLSLWRLLLSSKYKQHVRRGFRDFDLESLMSILYLKLVRPSNPPSNVKDEQELAVSLYQSNSEFTDIKHLQLMCWDEDEKPFDEEKREVSTYPLMIGNKAANYHDSKNDNFKTTLLASFHKNFTSPGTEYPFHMKDPFQPNYEMDGVNLYSKVVTMLSSFQLNGLMDFLNENDQVYISDEHYITAMESLVGLIRSFRGLIHDIFKIDKNISTGIGRHDFSVNGIKLELLLTEENALRKTVARLQQKQRKHRQSLDSNLMHWQCQVDEVKRNLDYKLRNTIRNKVSAEISIEKARSVEVNSYKHELTRVSDNLIVTRSFVANATKSLRRRRHYLEASLEALKRQYDMVMAKYQVKIDEFSVVEADNGHEIERLQNKFKIIEEKYDEMRAMKRLKQLLQNMEKAEAIKQNWAARKIQVCWRKYKVAKLRKKKLKGKRKGKKKTPPPGKNGSPPTKSSTPGSRSKSQTP